MTIIHSNDRRPYFALYGFTRRDDVLALVSDLPSLRRHIVVIGLLTAPEGASPPARANRYPSHEAIRAIVSSARQDARINYLLKYDPGRDQKNRPGLSTQMTGLLRALGVGPYVNGMQLSGVQPLAQELGIFDRTAEYGGRPSRFVLEVTPAALLSAGRPDGIVGTHVHYKTISDVVISFRDAPGGQINVETARGLLLELRSRYSHQIGYGISGNITSESLHELAPLIEEFPDLSLEVEDGIRDEDDDLDLDLAHNFLLAAAARF